MSTALQRGLAVCRICLAAGPADPGRCGHCGATLHPRVPHSVQRTLALCIAAAVLYVPANVLPIMVTNQFGRAMESTIAAGVVTLWEAGSYPVAVVIVIASVLIPLGKLAALGLLCWTVTQRRALAQSRRTTLYRITEFVGKWSMVDVFVVALLVALIQLGGIMVVRPGAAALAFAGVVIITMEAARTFDPRLIWDQEPDA